MSKKQEHLFPDFNTARYGDSRRLRHLFLPAYLEAESHDNRLKGSAQDNAYNIILKWAALESSGKLEKKTETALEGEFLTEVFGQALGYTLFSEHKDTYDIEPKFSVNGGQADAAIGTFKSGYPHSPRAVIELKGPNVNLDRDRFNGRTAVQQCWDYLNALPQCPWGIVCNYVSFRLYHRNHTPRAYELFTLQDLRKRDVFNQFYYLFERQGLLPLTIAQQPRADFLLERSTNRQREVGDDLYRSYQDNRLALIRHLFEPPKKFPLEKAIRVTQKLIDRIVFVAFCEDRGLLPQDSIKQAWSTVAPFDMVTNPKWQNFLSLFRSINEGNPRRSIFPYNGGLFRTDEDVDNLDLDDEWTNFFKDIGSYDFRHEVNVDVLGNLFEKSVNDLENIRRGALFEGGVQQDKKPRMQKSAARKRTGIYYTPPEFTAFIVDNTVAKIADERLQAVAARHGIDPLDTVTKHPTPEFIDYSRQGIDTLRQLKVVDPACGSGAFLIRAYQCLLDKYLDVTDNLSFYDLQLAETLKQQIPEFILHDNLFGVDLSKEAVEITQLALWIRSAHKGKSLADLSKNIVCGNSLVSDPAVHPDALDWQKAFPDVFSRTDPGFDCVIGNPPWERFTLKSREFFAFSAPHILEADSPAESRKLIDNLKTEDPNLYARYLAAMHLTEKTTAYVRQSNHYPLTGTGDINTYAVFAELAHRLVAPNGRVGILVPSGIATDDTTKAFFADLTNSKCLIGLFDFENKTPVFPDVHRSFKFCVLLFGGINNKHQAANFIFFARTMEDLMDKSRQITLSSEDFKLLNPNTLTCPVFRSNRDAELVKHIYRHVPILIDLNRKEGGNPWRIEFLRMFDQSNDSHLFCTADQLRSQKFRHDGAFWKKGKRLFLPLYEAKMIQMYDHRAASVIVDKTNWMRQGQTDSTSLVQHKNPEYVVQPRWWITESEVLRVLGDRDHSKLIAFKNVTSPTNERTMIASFIPYGGVIHSAPLIITGPKVSARLTACLLANLNSFVYDFVCRQKIGGINLSYFIINQTPVFDPDFYSSRCPWSKRETLAKWISERVLKLTCTSNDMLPLAKAAALKPLVHKWNPANRLDLQAQIDAAFFILYGIKRPDVEYVLSTFSANSKDVQGLFPAASPADRILKYYDTFCKKMK